LKGNRKPRSEWHTRDASQTEVRLYHMKYNWFGEEGEIYRHAVSLSRARRTFCRQLAKQFDTTEARVYYHLKEGNRYTITEVAKND
jgi:hypothetical protein